MSDALERIRALLADGDVELTDGYLDVMGGQRVPQTTAQRVMGSTVLPRIYERFWRPVVFWGFTLRNQRDEARQKLELLDINPGDTVLDVACGPGNTTREMQRAVGGSDGRSGLLVGVDSAATMLAQAVADTPAGAPVGYVRADAADLPFLDASFDAVSCYGALYLMDNPAAALAEMMRVLKPGGRIAVLTTCARGPLPVRQVSVAVSRLGALRLFDRDEVTDAFARGGLVEISRAVTAASQVVAARRPG
ncbi:MAG: methyltransferase type 11 [Mycobacterium sp.]|nr:methyltransferase type 11 [Mycobacterium sp.]